MFLKCSLMLKSNLRTVTVFKIRTMLWKNLVKFFSLNLSPSDMTQCWLHGLSVLSSSHDSDDDDDDDDAPITTAVSFTKDHRPVVVILYDCACAHHKTGIKKDTQTALFGKNVYWHIIVANVISYHIVAGITCYIVKSCKEGGETVYQPSPLRLLFFIALWASTNSNKQRKSCYTSIRCDIRDCWSHSTIQRSKVTIVKLQIKYYKAAGLPFY